MILRAQTRHFQEIEYQMQNLSENLNKKSILKWISEQLKLFCLFMTGKYRIVIIKAG